MEVFTWPFESSSTPYLKLTDASSFIPATLAFNLNYGGDFRDLVWATKDGALPIIRKYCYSNLLCSNRNKPQFLCAKMWPPWDFPLHRVFLLLFVHPYRIRALFSLHQSVWILSTAVSKWVLRAPQDEMLPIVRKSCHTCPPALSAHFDIDPCPSMWKCWENVSIAVNKKIIPMALMRTSPIPTSYCLCSMGTLMQKSKTILAYALGKKLYWNHWAASGVVPTDLRENKTLVVKATYEWW